jgi:uncharacterized phage-associated protein
MTMERTVAVANYFIGRSLKAPERPIYVSSLMALLMFAHGWRLGQGGPLLDVKFAAAAEGPEIPQLERMLRAYGNGPITRKLSLFVPDPADGKMHNREPQVAADDADLPLLEQVWNTLGKESSYLLHQLITQPYSPWAAAVHAGGGHRPNRSLPIEDERIQRWFIPRDGGTQSPLDITLAMIRSKSRSATGLDD